MFLGGMLKPELLEKMHLFGGVWLHTPFAPPTPPIPPVFRTGLDSIKQSMSGIPPANTWRSPWWFGLPQGPEAITCQAFIAPYTALHTISLEIKLWHREGFKFAVFYDNWAQFCSATGSSVQWHFASWHSAEFDWQLSQSSVWNTGAWQCGSGICVKQLCLSTKLLPFQQCCSLLFAGTEHQHL